MQILGPVTVEQSHMCCQALLTSITFSPVVHSTKHCTVHTFSESLVGDTRVAGDQFSSQWRFEERCRTGARLRVSLTFFSAATGMVLLIIGYPWYVHALPFPRFLVDRCSIDLKLSFGSVLKRKIEDNGLQLELRLLLVVETENTERIFAKRIVKYPVFPCMWVEERVSGFFESVDSVVSLAWTKLFENQIQRIWPLAWWAQSRTSWRIWCSIRIWLSATFLQVICSSLLCSSANRC